MKHPSQINHDARGQASVIGCCSRTSGIGKIAISYKIRPGLFGAGVVSWYLCAVAIRCIGIVDENRPM